MIGGEIKLELIEPLVKRGRVNVVTRRRSGGSCSGDGAAEESG